MHRFDSLSADCCDGVAGAGSSKKKARHAAATAVIAEMLKISEQSDQMPVPTSDGNNEYAFFSMSLFYSSIKQYCNVTLEYVSKH